METRKRHIKSGREYDHLFPPPSDQDITIKKHGDVEDTMKLIQRTVPKTLWHTEKIAKKLKGKSLNETCSNIWHFVYDHIQYKRDKDGVEQVRSPRRAWWERSSGVDCDCYTEFISSILFNLKIPHKARITKYPKKPPEVSRWQHVYVVVPKNGRTDKVFDERDDYITIDCVKDNYDDEQPYLECKDYNMQLDYLDGIDEDENGSETLQDVVYETVDAESMADLDNEELGKFSLKKIVKKVSNAVGKGVRFVNRFTNPATILLRGGFLLAMKVNLMNVAGKLRYAYLSDEQAKAMGMNLDSLNKLRKVKDKAETVYWQAGGKKENFKKAILSGRGNKDKKVSVNGLFGLDDVYADQQEYDIIHNDPDDLEGLGAIATGAALAAATSAVAAIAGALKQIKGIFNKGGKEEAAFQSDTDNAGNAASAEATLTEEEQIINEDYDASAGANLTTSSGSALPASASASRRIDTSAETQTQSTALQTTSDQNQGFVQKTTTWVKANPGKAILIAGATVAGGFVLAKVLGGNKKGNSVSGLPQNAKKKKSKAKKQKVQTIKL
jgi:hypothetical protein